MSATVPQHVTDHFNRLRQRWSHPTLQRAAEMTFIAQAASDEDADRQLRAEGQSAFARMRGTGMVEPWQTVYEIGCGVGRVATEITEYLVDGHYVGFDLSPQYVDLCRKRCPKGEFHATDGFTIPKPDNSADLVVSFTVLCHMPLELAWRWLCEARRVLKGPAGRTYIQLHNLASVHQWDEFQRHAENWRFLSDAGYPRAMTRETAELLFDKAGLEPIRWHKVDVDKGGPRSWFVEAIK